MAHYPLCLFSCFSLLLFSNINPLTGNNEHFWPTLLHTSAPEPQLPWAASRHTRQCTCFEAWPSSDTGHSNILVNAEHMPMARQRIKCRKGFCSTQAALLFLSLKKYMCITSVTTYFQYWSKYTKNSGCYSLLFF